MLISKKIRLVWDELYEPGYTSITPKVSYDEGNTWVDLGVLAGNARLNREDWLISAPSDTDGYNEVDITFAPCIDIVPEIRKITPTAFSTGFAAGDWYFAVSAITYDYPGFEAVSTNNYYNGSMSKVFKVTLTEASSLDIFVHYPKYTKGLALYWGQETAGTVNLNLHYISNITQKLRASITSSQNTIQLSNLYPLSCITYGDSIKGTIKIDSEYIDFNTCSWSGSYWQLSNVIRGARDTIQSAHTVSVDDPVEVFLCNDFGGNYGEIPERIYPIPELSESLVQYLNFNSGTLTNLVTGGSSPALLGKIEYSNDYALVNKCIKYIGAGAINTNQQLPSEGSIFFIHNFTDFIAKGNYSIPTTNPSDLIVGETLHWIEYSNEPVIFGSLDGLWMGICRTNLKPILGYKHNVLIKYNDPRTPSLSKTDLDVVGITWEKYTKTEGIFIKFKLYINHALCVEYLSNIGYDDFAPDIPYLGALHMTDDSYRATSAYLGYIDEWRIYNTILSLDDFRSIYTYILNSDSDLCGKISVKDLSKMPSLVANGSSININAYEPKITQTYAIDIDDIDTFGTESGTYLNNWLIDALYTNAMLPTGQSLIYPTNPETIKIRFDLESIANNFKTPKIKNIRTIVSEATLT